MVGASTVVESEDSEELEGSGELEPPLPLLLPPEDEPLLPV